MFARTSDIVPWNVVRADDKHVARLSVIKDLLTRLHYAHKDAELIRPDPEVVFPYAEEHLLSGAISK
ncbi:hypothetical protein D9M72_583780 [compost metagenome]